LAVSVTSKDGYPGSILQQRWHCAQWSNSINSTGLKRHHNTWAEVIGFDGIVPCSNNF
jgi:hypothetical protein